MVLCQRQGQTTGCTLSYVETEHNTDRHGVYMEPQSNEDELRWTDVSDTDVNRQPHAHHCTKLQVALLELEDCG